MNEGDMPDMSEHIHDCTGPDLTCPCGYVMHIPPVCVSFDVTERGRVLVTDGFNCESVDVAIAALREAADKLERER